MRRDLFQTYREPPPPLPDGTCTRCAGTKVFAAPGGRIIGECFACRGTGKSANVLHAAAPAVDAGQLLAAFERASAAGLRRPRLHFGAYTVSLAPPEGSNPGALYVKTSEGVYLGKITGGRFHASRECSAGVHDALAVLLANPGEAVRTYGQRTGACAICARTLTDSESIARGIGPVCAERFGF